MCQTCAVGTLMSFPSIASARNGKSIAVLLGSKSSLPENIARLFHRYGSVFEAPTTASSSPPYFSRHSCSSMPSPI